MKHNFRFLSAIVTVMLAAFVAGCANKPQVVTVTETQTTVLTAPRKFTDETPVPKPAFTKEQYDLATWAQRAQYNSLLATSLYRVIATCNADKASIRQWEEKEKASVAEANKKAAKAKK